MRVRFGDNLTSTISMDPLTIPQLKSSQPQLSTVLAPDVTHVYTHLSTSDRQKFEHALFKQNIAKKGNPGLLPRNRKRANTAFGVIHCTERCQQDPCYSL